MMAGAFAPLRQRVRALTQGDAGVSHGDLARKTDLRRGGGRRPDAHLTPAPAPTSKEPSRRSRLTVAQGR
jgi:hypothetical protein